MSDLKATVFNIQHYSIHDGPGIRTAVFFKGCNLRCKWCHNPESISSEKQLMFYPDKCIGCGKCLVHCKSRAHIITVDANGLNHTLDFSKCTGCLACVDTCFAEALVSVGADITVDKLLKQIVDQKPYYADTGGVTFTGGEAMLQVEFVTEIAKACKQNGVHTAIDTAGYVPYDYFEKVDPYIDLYLYDVKTASPELHKQFTGVDNTLILENLRKLSDAGKRIWVRIPLIEQLNGGEMQDIANILSDLNIEKVEVMGYHKLGSSKYRAMGMGDLEEYEVPSDAAIQQAQQLFNNKK